MTAVKNAVLFERFCPPPGVWPGAPKDWERSDLGEEQFHDHQSRGILPTDPSPYFLALTAGKKAFDWLTDEYRGMWTKHNGRDWWGLLLLSQDWNGERYLLKHLLSWWKKETGHDLPAWVYTEGGEPGK